VLPADKGALLRLLCGADLNAQPFSAVRRRTGHTNVKVFHAGAAPWKKAGGLVVSGPVAWMAGMKAGRRSSWSTSRPAAGRKGFIPGRSGIRRGIWIVEGPLPGEQEGAGHPL